MTIGDYIKEKMSIWSVSYSDASTQLELQRLGLDASNTITAETNIDEFFYNVIPDILLLPSSVSEGGYSITYDKDALLSYYKMLAVKLGKRDFLNENEVIDISNKW